MRSRTNGQGDLELVEVARVKEKLRDVQREECGGSVTALARLLGVSQPALTAILTSGRNKPSLALAAALARHLRIPTYVLLRADRHDPIPARARALARLEGILPASVRQQVRGIAVDDATRDEAAWIRFALDRLVNHQAERRDRGHAAETTRVTRVK